ncbi:MAG: nuclear transport factor 2 family protein, partial [Acidimicrobiia bacterium]|nr:nuclear transport factor 2 family protein [Acidimicrobiia bacterium]
DQAIRSLLARFARITDIGTVDEYCAALTDDAVFEMPGSDPRTGLDAARAAAEAGRAADQIGPTSKTMHLLGGTEVTVTGDTAESITSFVFLRLGDGRPAPHRAGRYYDTFRRTADGWRFAHRRIDLA